MRCGGRGGRDRRARRKRTAKSCGSGAAVLALSPGEAKLLAGDGGKRAVLRGEHEVSRKAITQGRPECFALPCMLVCIFFSANRTRDRGCSKHPVFPAPSISKRAPDDAKLGRFSPRECGAIPSCPLNQHHCDVVPVIYIKSLDLYKCGPIFIYWETTRRTGCRSTLPGCWG